MSDTKLTNCCLDGSIDKIRRDEDMRSSEIICNGTSVRNGEKVVNDVNVDVDVDVDGDVDVDVDVNDVNINGVTINDNCVEGLEEVMNGDLVVSAPVMMKSDNVKKKKKKKRLSLKPTDGRLGGGDNDDNGDNDYDNYNSSSNNNNSNSNNNNSSNNKEETVGDDEIVKDGGKRKSSLREVSSSADAFLEEFWNAGNNDRSSLNERRTSVSGASDGKDIIGDQYVGPLEMNSMCVSENLEDYFRSQVFTGIAFDAVVGPYFTYVNNDGEEAESSGEEKFIALWEEEIIPCGDCSRRKLKTARAPRRGFHGDVVKGEENACVRQERYIMVVSDVNLYFCVNDFAGDVVFSEAPRPNCVAKHSLASLTRCTIGFMFQRLVLGFTATGHTFTYNVMTKSNIACSEVLKVLTPLANEVKGKLGLGKLKMDNDSNFLTSFERSISSNSVILTYRIVKQQWKSGDRDPVMRALVVTDSDIYLLDENYKGDGVVSRNAGGADSVEESDGAVLLSAVDSFALTDITEVRPADNDPTQITLVFKQKGMLGRPHKWRLICRDNVTAEKIVEEVRKSL
jgi:hypothetical protein